MVIDASIIIPVIGGFIAILIASIVLIMFFRIQRRNQLSLRYELLERERERDRRSLELARSRQVEKTLSDDATTKTASKRIEEIINEKKQKFLSIPSISFHFADKPQIRDFYNEYFKEPTIESLVSEITGENTGEIKGKVPQIIESRIGSKDISKWISTIKLPDTSLNGMFLRFQRETIKNAQVVIGLEEVDIELTEIQAFEDVVKNLKERFGLTLDETIISNHKAHLKDKAAERTLVKLEQATGWVLMEGRFKIEQEVDFYKCVYLHSVNSYRAEQVKPVTISVFISSNSLEEHIKGNYAQSVGRLIPLKIYGQVWQPIDRQADIWDLQLTPLAIY